MTSAPPPQGRPLLHKHVCCHHYPPSPTFAQPPPPTVQNATLQQLSSFFSFPCRLVGETRVKYLVLVEGFLMRWGRTYLLDTHLNFYPDFLMYSSWDLSEFSRNFEFAAGGGLLLLS